MPLDLTTAEIEQMKSLVASVGEREPDIVKSVIVALDIVRPHGRQQPMVGPSAVSADDAKKPTEAKRKLHEERKSRSSHGVSKASLTDVAEHLRSLVVLGVYGEITAPQNGARIQLDGFEARIVKLSTGIASMKSSYEDASYNVYVTLEIESISTPVVVAPGSVVTSPGVVTLTILGVAPGGVTQ